MRRSVTIVSVVVVMLLPGAMAAIAIGGFGDWGGPLDIESFGAGAD